MTFLKSVVGEGVRSRRECKQSCVFAGRLTPNDVPLMCTISPLTQVLLYLRYLYSLRTPTPVEYFIVSFTIFCPGRTVIYNMYDRTRLFCYFIVFFFFPRTIPHVDIGPDIMLHIIIILNQKHSTTHVAPQWRIARHNIRHGITL